MKLYLNRHIFSFKEPASERKERFCRYLKLFFCAFLKILRKLGLMFRLVIALPFTRGIFIYSTTSIDCCGPFRSDCHNENVR